MQQHVYISSYCSLIVFYRLASDGANTVEDMSDPHCHTERFKVTKQGIYGSFVFICSKLLWHVCHTSCCR